MSEANKTTVRRLVEEVQNHHDLARMDAFFTPNFINHLEAPDLSSEHTAVERAKIAFRAMFAAFPDLHVTILDQVAEADKVVTHKLFQGTHQGTFMGIAPTGRQIAFAVIDILRLDNGRIGYTGPFCRQLKWNMGSNPGCSLRRQKPANASHFQLKRTCKSINEVVSRKGEPSGMKRCAKDLVDPKSEVWETLFLHVTILVSWLAR